MGVAQLGSSSGLGFVFPGQGSQKVGMLQELGDQFPVIQKTFRESSEVLGYDLWSLIQNDVNDDIGKTHITQPAILSASVAIWRLWLEQGGKQPALLAGHSLGEYSALVCSGVISFTDAVYLVQKRGEFMQSAVPAGIGAMAAIVGLDDELVLSACAEGAQNEVVDAVNFNSPGQVVIAGHKGAVDRAIELCKKAGAKRALPLAVSAPFHSSLMKPAAERFAKELASIELNVPKIPVIQNYAEKGQNLDSGLDRGLDRGLDPVDNVELIRNNLIKQIYSPVPWVDIIKSFSQKGIHLVFELGPGKVLCGLNRRIDSSITNQFINNKASLEAALEKQT